MNSCAHTYCKECIEEWVKVENTCPACKRRVHKILTKDILGRDVERLVEDRQQGYVPSEESDYDDEE